MLKMLAFMHKNQRYFHHKDFQKPHHSHGGGGGSVGSKNTDTREIKIVRKVLDVNDTIAHQNRKLFREKGVFVINVMSSPGRHCLISRQKSGAPLLSEIFVRLMTLTGLPVLVHLLFRSTQMHSEVTVTWRPM
jgi:hydrogenase nickel incorporation protein HypB